MTPTRIGVTGIVLAGGRSSRFGASKLDADLDGMTVLDRTIDRLRPVVDEVLVVGRAGSRPGIRCIDDPRPFEGPLAGLAAGLEIAGAEVVIMVGGDMPLVERDVLRLLVDRLRGGTGTVAVLQDGSQPRPLPMALRRDVAREAAVAAIAAGERSLRAFLTRLRVDVVPEREWRVLDPEGDSLIDVDTPADLERARTGLRD
jgi:molybdopterin-guanine dinucleotide biosynthesis protein A